MARSRGSPRVSGQVLVGANGPQPGHPHLKIGNEGSFTLVAEGADLLRVGEDEDAAMLAYIVMHSVFNFKSVGVRVAWVCSSKKRLKSTTVRSYPPKLFGI